MSERTILAVIDSATEEITERGTCDEIGVALRRAARTVQNHAPEFGQPGEISNEVVAEALSDLGETIDEGLFTSCTGDSQKDKDRIVDLVFDLAQTAGGRDGPAVEGLAADLAAETQAIFDLPDRGPVACFEADNPDQLQKELNMEIASRREPTKGISGAGTEGGSGERTVPLANLKACILFGNGDR